MEFFVRYVRRIPMGRIRSRASGVDLNSVIIKLCCFTTFTARARAEMLFTSDPNVAFNTVLTRMQDFSRIALHMVRCSTAAT